MRAKGILCAAGCVGALGVSTAHAEAGADGARAPMSLYARDKAVVQAARHDISKYRVHDVVVEVRTPGGEAVPNVHVRARQIGRHFRLGCNFYQHGAFKTEEENRLYDYYHARVFDFATIPFYYNGFIREGEEPNWGRRDTLAAAGAGLGHTLKGHPLIWFYDPCYPDWARKPYDEMRPVILETVRKCVERYKGTIDIWDVVNEMPVQRGPTGGFKLTFAELVDLTRDALAVAREANPEATLIVNDFGIISDPDGMSNRYGFFRALIDAGADFDVVGIQAHMMGRDSLWIVYESLRKYSDLGKPIHVTEVTVLSKGEWGPWYEGGGQWTEEIQADVVRDFYTVCFAVPSIEAVTWWDLCDRQTWQPYGGLLRADFTPKPAYHALEDLVASWTTKVILATGADGRAGFRGYAGEYELTLSTAAGPAGLFRRRVPPGGGTITITLHPTEG